MPLQRLADRFEVGLPWSEGRSMLPVQVVLEAEVVNTGALRLYQGLGFVRDKRLHR